MTRTAWTDERLDDLSTRMDAGFDRVDRDIRDLRTSMEQRFAVVDQRFDSMEQRFERRADSLDRTVRWFGGSLLIGMAGTILTVLLTAP